MWVLVENQFLHAISGAEQADIGFLAGEHTHGHHARPLVDFGFERQWVVDVQAAHIEDVLAVVGDIRLAVSHAQAGVAAQGRKLADDACCGHRDDFHGQRESAKYRYAFAFIRDADETRALRRHDFFARERPAAALDHVAARVDFVGAIDVDIQQFNGFRLEYRNAVRA